MTARYGIIDLEDDPEIPTFNFEAVSLPPALTMGTTGQSIRPRSSSKLNARSVTSLQVLSPRARAANAIGSPQQLPQPAAQTAARDKGKGRARPIDIIELSDSDSDEAPVASTSRSAIGLSRPTPSAGWPPASSTRTPARDVEVTATSVPKRNTPPNDVPTLPVAPEATVEPVVAEQPRVEEELHVAEASNVNHLDQLIASVLEIVPDVDPDHVKTMFTVNNPDGSIERATELLQPILHSLFESGNYPKKVEAKRKRQEDPDAPVAGPSQPKKRRVETVVRMNIASRNRPRIYSANYSDLCMYWLGVKFPYLRKAFLTRKFASNSCLYAPTFVHITKLISAGAIPATQRKKQPTNPGYLNPLMTNEEFDRELQWCADWHPGKPEEIEYTVESDLDSANQPPPNGKPSTSNQRPEEEAVESEECETGEGMECGTCCSEYVVTTMIQCPDGHLFCKGCVFRLSKERLGQRSTKIKCMDSQTDCQLEFLVAQLELCLPPRLLALYHRVKQAEEISAAGLENLEECPFCEYKCVIENENERLFRCENEECGAVSCRGCKKKDHLPKTCAEMEEDNTLNAQHTVEEAMTNALMRKCPKCQATFVKTDGCNKITCSKCKQLSCYICRKAITGYEHFNQAPPGVGRAGPSSSQQKCALWDGPTGAGGAGLGLDQRHHDEVARAREEALTKLRQSNPDVDVSRVKVDAPTVPTIPVQQQPPYALPPLAYVPMPVLPRVQAIPGYLAPPLNPIQVMQERYALLARQVPQPQLRPPGRVAVPRRCNCINCRGQ